MTDQAVARLVRAAYDRAEAAPPRSGDRRKALAEFDRHMGELMRRALLAGLWKLHERERRSCAAGGAAAPAQRRPPVSEQFPHERTPWRAIAAEIRYAAEHDLMPGQPVGSIDQLAGMYKVNRKTAHKALRALAAEGLIELRPGRGYFKPGEHGQATPVSPLSAGRQRAASSAAVARTSR
jgi:DNA-binding transcriptional regulator YhcF (GntR family)